jgi:carboxylesterase type B
MSIARRYQDRAQVATGAGLRNRRCALRRTLAECAAPEAIDASALGASHASEISHVFGDPVRPTADDTTVSEAMNGYWARFAATGDPNGAGAPQTWPAFAPDASDNDQRLQLDAGWEVVSDFRKPECAFWRQQYDAAFATP